MESQENNHQLATMSKLRKLGFNDALQFRNGSLYNLTKKVNYDADEVHLYHEFRFEGMSNPDDLSILFAVEFSDGNKGTFTTPYGPKANPEVYEFMNSCAEKKINIGESDI